MSRDDTGEHLTASSTLQTALKLVRKDTKFRYKPYQIAKPIWGALSKESNSAKRGKMYEYALLKRFIFGL